VAYVENSGCRVPVGAATVWTYGKTDIKTVVTYIELCECN
jgi:hypothetical protein